MITPAGKNCRHYYEDFNRGRNVQECRLNQVAVGETLPWQPKYCAKCPIPDILNANSSPDLELTLNIKPVVLGLGRRVVVSAKCLKHLITIDDPYIGCPQCNAERPGLEEFIRALEQDESQ